MSDLLSLISRLEAAKEGSREMDQEIWFNHVWEGQGDERDVPAYTSSVDAALSHEAEGFWEIYGPYKYLNIPTPIPNRWRAVLWYGPELHAKKYEGWGATEALARRIASLRARATT
jgi:hypothetical protein